MIKAISQHFHWSNRKIAVWNYRPFSQYFLPLLFRGFAPKNPKFRAYLLLRLSLFMETKNTSEQTSKDRTAYFKSYWAKNRKVTVTLTLSEFNQLNARAKKHSLTAGQMLLAESRAYQNSEFVPTNEIISKLDDTRRLLRNIGNNLNQAVKLSHRFKILVSQKQIFQMLERLERDMDDLIRKPFTHVHPKKNGQ